MVGHHFSDDIAHVGAEARGQTTVAKRDMCVREKAKMNRVVSEGQNSPFSCFFFN